MQTDKTGVSIADFAENKTPSYFEVELERKLSEPLAIFMLYYAV